MRVVNRSVVLLLILASASSGEAATEVKQILVVQSLDQATLTFGALADDLKVELSRRLPEPLNFVKFSLEPPGLGEVSDEGLVAYLRSLFPAVRRPDLIVTVGAPAALFVRAHEAQLFPAAPVLMVGVDGRFLNGAPLPANVATVAVTHDVPRMIQTIVQLFPDTAHLFVVNGTSKLEQSWQVAIGREMAQFPRLTLEWANGLSFAEMLTRTATLPAHSVVLFVLFNVDAQGAGYDEERVIRAIHERANAPMFGFQSTALGQGIVGGPLMPIDDVGHHAVDAAVRLLNGESPGHIRTPAQEPGLPVFDWRELRRWHVDESRLPSGSVVQFREPTLWQRRKWQLMTAGLIGIAESLLIIGLVVNLATRKRTERALRESEERFRRLADTAPVMIWMSGLDQRCTDVNRSWLDFTGRSRDEELGIGWASVVHPDDVADMRDVATRAFERREPYRNEYRVRRHDGEYRWMLDCAAPRFSPDGTFAGFIGSVVDQTDQRAARMALSNLGQRLIEAQEQERARLARELHDDVGQRLSLLSMELDHLRRSASHDSRSSAETLWNQCASVLRDVQGISYRLHSAKLELLGIATAAAGACQALSGAGANITFTQDQVPRDIAHDVSLAIFRVLQEALNNATKYSGAQHIVVALRGTPQDIQLDVIDDGCGFDPNGVLSSSGLGLVSMQERLKLVGGRLIIESNPGEGTVIRAIAPLREQASA